MADEETWSVPSVGWQVKVKPRAAQTLLAVRQTALSTWKNAQV